MSEILLITLINGRNNAVGSDSEILSLLIDFCSGFSQVKEGQNLTIKENKQMINFTMLTVDGDITLNGDLWLA